MIVRPNIWTTSASVFKDNSKCEVCTLEIDRQDNEKNYTIDTIKELKKIYKNDQLYFMMGMDQASHFEMHMYKHFDQRFLYFPL